MLLKIGLCVLLALTVVSCSKSEAAPRPSESAHAIGTSSSAVHETPNYKVVLEPVGTYEEGKPAQVNVVLTTKGDYHINDQYPYKFVVQEPAAYGVSYVKKTVRRADGVFEKTRAEIPVRFTPSKSGTVQVGGILWLSVCTASNCLLDKRPLQLDVTIR